MARRIDDIPYTWEVRTLRKRSAGDSQRLEHLWKLECEVALPPETRSRSDPLLYITESSSPHHSFLAQDAAFQDEMRSLWTEKNTTPHLSTQVQKCLRIHGIPIWSTMWNLHAGTPNPDRRSLTLSVWQDFCDMMCRVCGWLWWLLKWPLILTASVLLILQILALGYTLLSRYFLNSFL